MTTVLGLCRDMGLNLSEAESLWVYKLASNHPQASAQMEFKDLAYLYLSSERTLVTVAY